MVDKLEEALAVGPDHDDGEGGNDYGGASDDGGLVDDSNDVGDMDGNKGGCDENDDYITLTLMVTTWCISRYCAPV